MAEIWQTWRITALYGNFWRFFSLPAWLCLGALVDHHWNRLGTVTFCLQSAVSHIIDSMVSCWSVYTFIIKVDNNGKLGPSGGDRIRTAFKFLAVGRVSASPARCVFISVFISSEQCHNKKQQRCACKWQMSRWRHIPFSRLHEVHEGFLLYVVSLLWHCSEDVPSIVTVIIHTG